MEKKFAAISFISSIAGEYTAYCEDMIAWHNGSDYHIRFLIDDDAQVEGMLIHIDPDHASDNLIYSVIGYCVTHGMPYSITSWADFIND